MKSRQYMRIEKLQRKYSETNIAKDEELPVETVRRINKNYQDNQLRRRVDGLLNYTKNRETIKEEVQKMVADLPNLKLLCRTCKEEVIITVIILYVQKSYDPRFRIERTALWKKYDLSWQRYGLILGRLLDENRKKQVVRE